MNVLIAADMEGVAGIDHYGDCLPSHPADYARGRRLMTDEVLVAIDALRRGGVEQISVGDWHMVGTNIERERMPEGVVVRPIADLALVEADPSITKAHGGGPLDAVVLLGHHASTPSPRGFCSHTFVWDMEVQLDGESLSEVRVYAQALAAEGIPVLVATGDRWMLDELRAGELGSAKLVAMKEGHNRAGAQSRSLAATRADLLTAIATVFRDGEASREYRQLAKLLPAGHDSLLRAAQRRLGSLLATPVMRSKERRWLAASPG
jgi:D-aminopeptidase